MLGVATANAAAQQSVWQIWNYLGTCHFGTTTNSAPPIEEPGPWGPSGWPGTVWWGWDVETVVTRQQFCYVECGNAPTGAGILGKHWFAVYQHCTFTLQLTAESYNQFTRTTASLRNPSGQVMFASTAEPGTTQPVLTEVITLGPGNYELRVESPSLPGGPRSGKAVARVDFISTDGDQDGVPDAQDGCPQDPNKTLPGICGCGVADTDSDADGAADCLDGCPSDPAKVSPGQCGCGFADTDGDSDSVADCVDACPSDPTKSVPGFCGCGVPDTDADSDGWPNCVDNCPLIGNVGQEDCDDDEVGDSCEIAEGVPDSNRDGIPDPCQCIADVFTDGVVNGADLGVILAQWGPAATPLVGDINIDGVVDGEDLAFVLSAWGPCQD